MRLWKIVPVAPPHDPRWQDHRIWREVVVRAETAAMARLIAAELERDASNIGVGNETLKSRSAFDDEKLYWVVETEAEAGGADEWDGPPGVVRAEPLERGTAIA